MADAVVEEYITSLEDLTFNSKPHINALTMLAEEYVPHAGLIVRVIEAKLNKALPNGKLPLMYLMDSIVKNVGGNYTPLFAKNIVKNFFTTFDTGDEKTKISLHRLRFTWDNYFPLKKLYELDVTIHNIDSNWPVKPLPASLQDKPSTSIHVNPKFLKKADAVHTPSSNTASTVKTSAAKESVDLKQDLINKQKQLLDLQQQKLLLELEQTKQQLALREKRNQIAAKKQADIVSKDPRLKQPAASTNATNLRVTVTNGQKQQSQARAPAKDPRSHVAGKLKQTASVTTKKASVHADPRMKVEAQRKLTTDASKAKTIVKKSPELVKKKKLSPNNSTKAKAAKTPSPKNSVKAEATKKTKVIKKKTYTAAVKSLAKGREELSPHDNIDNKARSKGVIERDLSKKRDRPVRRSPARGHAPPAKQARRSTSLERRKSSSPPRRNSDFDRKNFHKPAPFRDEERFHRESPRSNEGSISPRFSPEPDEQPPGRGQNWRPAVKRRRQMHQPPQHWQQEENLPPRPGPLVRRRSSVDPNLRIPQELTLSHQAEILKQAEIQLQTGQLTHVQHQELLKQLHQLFELQRLRNQQQHLDCPPMPLDQLLPERHDDNHEFQGPSIPRREDDHQSAFRPPPSPPRMDVDREREGFRRPPHTHRLTPPPMHTTDPRMGRPHHQPQNDDPRFRNNHDELNRPPPHHFHENHEQRRFPRHRTDNIPHHNRDLPPIRRRGSGDWEEPQDHGRMFVKDVDSPIREEPFYPMQQDHQHHMESPPISQSSNIREDRGNIYVMEGDTHLPARKEPLLPLPPVVSLDRSRGSVERQHDRREVSELQNDDKPNPERVPLRAYAHPDKIDESKPAVKRRHSHSDKERSNRSPLRSSHSGKPKRHPRRTPPKDRQAKETVKSDDEDDIPRLEEPEDYIIANIPPEAEVYHKHSMTLKRSMTEDERAYREHKKNILLSTYTKKIASENSSEDVEDLSKSAGITGEIHTNLMLSPDFTKRDKIEEEVNKSPSLPLKKRKYLMSSSSDRKDSSDGGVTTEPESDTTEVVDKTDGVGESKNEVEVEKESKFEAEEEKDAVQPVAKEEIKTTEEEDKDSSEKMETESSEKLPEPADKPVETNGSNTKEQTKNKSKKLIRRRSKDDLHDERAKGNLAVKDGKRGGSQRKAIGQRMTDKKRESNRSDRKMQLRNHRLDGENQLHEKILKEEEEMFRLQVTLEKELELEHEELIRRREMDEGPPGRGRPMQRGWGRGRGDNGPWPGGRGRGGFGGDRRGRHWRGDEERPEHYPSLMDDAPLFTERRPPGRGHPPPGRRPLRPGPMDERDWYGPPDIKRDGMGPPEFDRPWNEGDRPGRPFRDRDNGPVPIRRPRPGPRGERMHPPRPHDRMEMDRFRGPFPDGPNRPRPHPPGPADEFNQVNVNKLLSDLLNMGIIPGNTTKPAEANRSRNASPNRTESPIPANLPLTDKSIPDGPLQPEAAKETLNNLFNKSVAAIEQDANRVPTPVYEDLLTLDPDASLPEVTFDDMDKLKLRCDELIKRIYTGIQCSACGMRFTACQTDMYAEHLDWHYRMNRKDRDGIKDTHRQLYPTAGDWIMYEEIVDPSKRVHNEVFDEVEMQEDEQIEATTQQENSEDLVVPVAQHPDQDKCTVCNEAFKTVYNDEEEEWQYVNCVAVEGKNFHPACYADHNDHHDPAPLPTPVRVPLYNPIESSLKGIPGLDTLLQEEESEPDENVGETGVEESAVMTEENTTDVNDIDNSTTQMEHTDEPYIPEVQNADKTIDKGEDSSISSEDETNSVTTVTNEDDSKVEKPGDGETSVEAQTVTEEPVQSNILSTSEENQHVQSGETTVKLAKVEDDSMGRDNTENVEMDVSQLPATASVKLESDNEASVESFSQNENSKLQNTEVQSNITSMSLPFISAEVKLVETYTDTPTKIELKADSESVFPIPTLGQLPIESNEIDTEVALAAKVESPAREQVPFPVASDQPPPPGTGSFGEDGAMDELESGNESDSEDDISVEI